MAAVRLQGGCRCGNREEGVGKGAKGGEKAGLRAASPGGGLQTGAPAENEERLMQSCDKSCWDD